VITIKKSTVGESAKLQLGSLPEYSGTLKFIVNDKEIICPKFAIVNGNPESSLYEVKDGDKIEMQKFYTLEQLFTFMDIEPVSNVYINNAKAKPQDKIFDNFIVNWIDDEKLKEYVAKVNTDDEKAPDEPVEAANHTEPSKTENEQAYDAAALADLKNKENKQEEAGSELHIIVNDTPVTLQGKTEYRLVDVLDFYDFDMSEMQGKKLITNHDGHHAEFIELLHEDSRIELFWEK
jgi:hypothetical protein